MIQKFKRIVLILMLVLTSIIACQYDDNLHSNQQQNIQEANFSIRIERGMHLKDLNPKIYQKLTKFQSSDIAKDGTNNYPFYLDLNTIQIIERNSYTQYTTPIIGYSEQETYLVNYVLFVFEDGSEYQFLVKYPYVISDQRIEIDQNSPIMESIGGDTILDKSGINGVNDCLNGVPEIINSYQLYQCTEFRCTGDGHRLGEECNCGRPGYSCTTAFELCGWKTVNVWGCSGGSSASNSSTNNSSVGNGNNTPDNNNQDEPIETIPVFADWELVVECINNGIHGSLDPNNTLPLSTDDINWLKTLTGSGQASAIVDFINYNGCDGNIDFIEQAIDAMILQDITFKEFIEQKVDELVENNPLALLEIDCDQIQNWQTLAQHTAPQAVQDKIDGLPSSWTNDFYIQELDNAGGTAVNMDYFSVKINTFPVKPNSNPPVRYTPDEYLDYIRRNFNDFVDGSTFEPYCEINQMCQTETDLWNSTNPVGAIIYIDIPNDDGVVVCTEYTNSYWYFMTMNAPYAGNHPVSGTRQFGYETNIDGSYNFFVRGVDRFNNNSVENLVYIISLGDPFSGADSLWRSFQNKLKDHVNNNNGVSTKNIPIKNRPDWEKVKKVLKGELPITELGCNN